MGPTAAGSAPVGSPPVPGPSSPLAFDPTDEWFRRPDVWSGVVLGAWAIARSFGPSLMPRATAHQALVSGASAAAGFAVGNATYGIVGDDLPLDEQLALFTSAAACGLVARGALRPDADLPQATLRGIAGALAAGSIASASVGLVRRSQRPGVTAAVLAGAGGAAASVSMALSIRDQLARKDDVDPPPPRPLPAVAQSATVAGVLAAVVNGYRHSGRAAAQMVRQRFGLSHDVSRVVGRTGATMVWGAVIAAFVDTFVRGMELYDRVMDPGYDQPPASTARSAGPGSNITFSRSGRQGRRFLLDVPSAAAIAEVMGAAPVAEPVRVFVGYDAAGTAEERVALALAELARTGAYDRSLLIVASPAGTGVTNAVPFETADYLLRGDSAGVAVQYERLPSLLCLHRTGVGGHHHRLLLEGIRDALAERPPSKRPRVVVYGESLGAWAGQNAFLHRGVDGLDELGVERALWVGTPYYSGWRREVLGDGAASPGAVREVASVLDLRALPSEQRDALRVVLLTQHNDPVAKLNLDLLVQRPPWLDEDRPPTVSPRQRYTALITGLQTMVDASNATNPVPGVFRATGHDYRLSLPAVTMEVYRLPRPSPVQWERLMTRLQADEAARAARFRRPEVEELEAAAASSMAVIDLNAPG
jgi:uncharacterized membrane protein